MVEVAKGRKRQSITRVCDERVEPETMVQRPRTDSEVLLRYDNSDTDLLISAGPPF